MKSKAIALARKTWVELELRKGEAMREIWEIEARQNVLAEKLKRHGEFERTLQELAEVDPSADFDNRTPIDACKHLFM